MADVQEIDWPSFDTVLRELSPERYEAREQRNRERAIVAAAEAAAAEEARAQQALAQQALARQALADQGYVEQAHDQQTPGEQEPQMFANDIASVVSEEISEPIVEREALNFLQEDPFSDPAVEQTEFDSSDLENYVLDLDNLAEDDLTVSPQEAAEANFIVIPPELDTTQVQPVESQPRPEQKSPLTSLFNEVIPDELIAEDTIAEDIIAEDTVDLTTAPDQAPAPSNASVFTSAPEIDDAPPAPSPDDLTTPAPIIDLDSEPASGVEYKDPWAEMRPSPREDVTQKKIVFWANRPKFFGGDERHKARAQREAEERRNQ